jgi:hypothetical protein
MRMIMNQVTEFVAKKREEKLEGKNIYFLSEIEFVD